MTELEIVEALLAQCRRDHALWINGDASGYEFDGDDDTIMGAFGGLVVGAANITPGQRGGVVRFEKGSGDIELVRSGVSGDIAWLVMIERARVHFAGKDEPSRWELRVTEIFRRDGERWVRTHRHADPLVDRHGLAEVLTLLPA